MTTKSEMVCNGLIRVDEIREVSGPTAVICKRISRIVLESLYGLILPKPKSSEDQNRPPNPEELLTAYGYVRGFMTAYGLPDKHRAARIIIKDFVDGKLLYCHPPKDIAPEEFNPIPKLKKLIGKPTEDKEESTNQSEQESKEDPLEIREYDLEGDDNPNNRQKKARGRKYHRREKVKQQANFPVFTSGRNPNMYQGLHTSIPGASLPTNIKLKSKTNT